MTIKSVSFATFNVRGLNDATKQRQLSLDIDRYRVDIACLQETKIKDGVDVNIADCRLITFETDCPNYGLGFIINKKWKRSIQNVWKETDRIAVLQLTTQNEQLITLVNVYGPTSQLASQKPAEIIQLYDRLNSIVAKYKNKSVILLCGDFNAKVGKTNTIDREACLGNYSKGTRNRNGQQLIDFCDSNGYFIANSAFKHRACHITTWQGQWRNRRTGEIIPTYNQIDFIICPTQFKKCLRNARSYSGTLTYSDHRIVIAEFEIEWHRIWSNSKQAQSNEHICVSKLVNNEEAKVEYNNTLKEGLEKAKRKKFGADLTWEETKIIIKTAARSTLGLNAKRNTTPNRTIDDTIIKISEEQKKLRLQIDSCKNASKRQELKKSRNKLLHENRQKVKELRNEELNKKAEEISNLPDHAQMFRAVKSLNKKKFENPKILDENNKFATDVNKIHAIIHKHFEGKFRDKDAEDIIPFEGDPRSLNKNILVNEVRDALKRLNNNRACGEDGIPGELLKYGIDSLDNTLASILNNIFKNHEDIRINDGILITLQKPGKPKGPVSNLRPITLLNTLRKVLSLIVLQRTRNNVEAYLSPSQSGFRKGRSTADIVWAHRWLVSKVYAENMEIFITGIDMSSAFDTISRRLLIDILRDIIEEDELRIIRYLLSNTNIAIKVENASSSDTFVSNIGTPQGDSLSPVLFVIYLEHALRKIRPPPGPGINDLELAYADDVDFVSNNGFKDVNDIQKHLAEVNLNVNTNKTEYTTIQKSETESWRNSKKVGSLLGHTEDIKRRKQLSNAALFKLNAIWIRSDKVKLQTRLNLYRALVKSILLYNCGTWPTTKRDEEQLNTFHRKQLRAILNIKYPTIIKNKALYEKTQEVPLSLTVLENRWRLFGHILRQDTRTPANQAMKKFFKQESSKRRGKPKTSIISTLRRDLKKHPIKSLKNKLKSLSGLEHLRKVAQDREQWKQLVTTIYRFSQAEASDDISANGN